ncbi:helix-turn-helix transcriptional regulator [Streptomyces sp. H10-C2]|uniref:helix-turn-helix domain-containing protein n=1 Tax=unclassified Streptomyces TaxID=2593676 RepID=UPI0024B881EF|nr:MULTISPECIES: helix-turn-helix transcriptional regulator [unclassified Streptomyces]MDJ0342763.1 helix-turn-helix transcriptional regulator [Streptomyces sp. PH10-H1]MDJ0372441.1 helix-turn-helix transcriptional regulator [Streptomyces sp. H10-C2]
MPQWSEYSTGQRLKILRGKRYRQADVATGTGLSIVTVQKAEQDKALSLPTLLTLAAFLGVDTAVILGQQAPRRAMEHDDRMMIRALSCAVHDISAGMVPETEEPSTLEELRQITDHAWALYWKGHYSEAGAIIAPFLGEAAATLHTAPEDQRCAAWGVLADAYRIGAYVANLMGSRDLAYAAIGHAREAASHAADPLREALVLSGRAWVYLRDARLEDSFALAERAAVDIEPRFSKATPEQLVVFGSHVNFAAVVASRMGDKERAGDLLSQSHGIGARMGAEKFYHGTLFGPVSAATQAVGVNVALGLTGKALSLVSSIRDTSPLTLAARNRYAMDKALAQADAKQWDSSLDTLEKVLTESPKWARHQALPSVIVDKVGSGSTAQLRRVAALLDAAPRATGFAPANRRTAL